LNNVGGVLKHCFLHAYVFFCWQKNEDDDDDDDVVDDGKNGKMNMLGL